MHALRLTVRLRHPLVLPLLAAGLLFVTGRYTFATAQSPLDPVLSMDAPVAAELALDAGDYATAENLFRRDWLAHDATGAQNLARLYQLGLGVSRDANLACDWFEKAAKAGLVAAMDDLGQCYAQGAGRARSGQQAMIWYRRAMALGSKTAKCRLGRLYLQGRVDLAQDQELGASLCLEAARDGDPSAMVTTGQLALAGIGLPRDAVTAVNLIRQAAEAGRTDAAYLMGQAYAQGQGELPALANLAEPWWLRAARAGHGPAMVELGAYYAASALDPGPASEDGSKVAKPYEARRAWFWLGLAQQTFPGTALAVRAAAVRETLKGWISPAQEQHIAGEIASWRSITDWRQAGFILDPSQPEDPPAPKR